MNILAIILIKIFYNFVLLYFPPNPNSRNFISLRAQEKPRSSSDATSEHCGEFLKLLNFALLKKLGRGRRPVLLKRAPGATLKEWAMAAEYILDGGNAQVILCERGVRGLERELRYTLDLAGALWMQKRYRLPVVIDPSHATGAKALIPDAAVGAMNMGFAGVMVEVHPDPSLARSDALQALTFEEFSQTFAKYKKSAR